MNSEMLDLTNSFSRIRKDLIDANLVEYPAFRATCKPMRFRAAADFALTFTIFILSVLMSIFYNSNYLFIMPFLLVIGLSLHKLSLFFHEAAHHNLWWSNKAINDKIANLLIGIFLLDDIKNYRTVHLAHHRYFGSPNDPENTYQERLSLVLFAELLLGIRVFKVMTSRGKLTNHNEPVLNHVRAAGVVLYGMLLIWILSIRRDPLAALIVYGGIFSVFPFIAGLRQLLEHRQPKNGTTRIFAQSPFAIFFSGVGFAYHLIHHWDPQIHYTTFPKIHSYFLRTKIRTQIEMVSSNYRSAIIKLWGVK